MGTAASRHRAFEMRTVSQARSLPGLSRHLALGRAQGRTTAPRQAVRRLWPCVLPAPGPARSAPSPGTERRFCAAPCAMCCTRHELGLLSERRCRAKHPYTNIRITARRGSERPWQGLCFERCGSFRVSIPVKGLKLERIGIMCSCEAMPWSDDDDNRVRWTSPLASAICPL